MKVIAIDDKQISSEDFKAKLGELPEISEVNLFPSTVEALEWLENICGTDAGKSRRIRIRCFGTFEVFADDKPMKFRYTKSKELLAYLVDRNGALCDINTLCAVLWEEKEDSPGLKSMLRHLIADLKKSFAACGSEDALVRYRGMAGIRTDRVECDYYDWLRGKESPDSPYQGEYMSQYSWAEATAGSLAFMNGEP